MITFHPMFLIFFDAVIDLVSYLEGGPAISAINKLEFGSFRRANPR